MGCVVAAILFMVSTLFVLVLFINTFCPSTGAYLCFISTTLLFGCACALLAFATRRDK